MKYPIWMLCFFLVTTCSLTLTAQSDENYGTASYYSDSFQGKQTASGELYDKDKLTAAHKSLTFGTVIKVTRLDDNRSVQVTVNDRGPFIKGRIVELSRRAAERIGLVQDGLANVKIEVVGRGSAEPSEPIVSAPTPRITTPAETRPESYSTTQEPTVTTPAPAPTITPAPEPRTSTPSTETAKGTATTSSRTTTTTASPDRSSVPSAAPAGEKVQYVGKDYQTYDLYQINLIRPSKTGYGVQVASLTQYENVLKQVADLQAKWFRDILLSVEKGVMGDPVYKVILGPFSSETAAENYKKDLLKKHKIKGFVVNLSNLQR